jgi:hypothetical protein
MMMIQKSLFLLFLSAALTDAFVLLPFNKSSVAASVTALKITSYDGILARLQNEYKELQQTLLDDLATHKKVEADQVAETILEKAVDVAAVQRYQQMDIIDEAQKELMHASDDRMRAHALHEQAHAEAVSAEREAASVESIDAAYEDKERLRDLSVAHASHKLENDAEDLVIKSAFKELEASSKMEAAAELLKQLEENEALLKDSLKQMRDFRNTKAMEEWKKTEAPKHEMFLGKVKALMNRLDKVKEDVMNNRPDLGS